VLCTYDGGKNWKSNYIGLKKNLNAIYFLDNLTGFVVGHDVTIAKTLDGGVSWNILSEYNKSIAKGIGKSVELNDIKFLNSNTGWTIGDDGKIFSTTDCGNTWLEDKCPGYKELNELYIFDEYNIWISASNGTLFKLITKEIK